MKELLILVPPIFNFASSQNQVATTIDFTEKVLGLSSNAFQTEFAEWTIDQLKDEQISGEKALKLAITAFDYCLSDEIRKRNGILPSLIDDASIYYRFYPYKAWYPPEVINRLSAHLGIPIKDLVISTPNQIFHPSFPKGEKGMLTPDLAFWINKVECSKNEAEPISNTPRQEFYKSLMRCGINPFASVQLEEVERNNDSESKYKRLYRRKGVIYINSSSDKVHDWEMKTASHWKRLLNQEQMAGVVNSEIYLFNCGFSANGSIIYALSTLVKGKVYRHPFWYFENITSISELFSDRLTTTFSDAKAVFLNLEPTNYSFLESQDFVISPYDVMRIFMERARSQNSKRFYLVIDATVDLTFSLEDLVDNPIPPNLTFIKTASITKHQSGGRNYFYGAALVINGEDVAKEIEKQRIELGGQLFEQQAVFFPRPSTEQIRKRREKVSLLNKHIARISDFGENAWQIIPYTFHSLLYPPKAFIDAIAEYCRRLQYDERAVKMTLVNKRVSDLIAMAIAGLNMPTIEFGDSFGLPQTRIDRVGGESCIDGVRFWLKIPRICLGYETKLDDAARLAEKLIAVFSSEESKLLEPLSLD